MSTIKTMLGRSVNIAIIGFVKAEERAYQKVVLPDVMKGAGYSTKLEKMTYHGKKRGVPCPIVMIFRFLALESISPPNALNEVMYMCRISPPKSDYTSAFGPNTSKAVFFEQIVGEKVWAPKNLQELCDAVKILGLTTKICQPF